MSETYADEEATLPPVDHVVSNAGGPWTTAAESPFHNMASTGLGGAAGSVYGGAGGISTYQEPSDWRMQQEYDIARERDRRAAQEAIASRLIRCCHNQTHVFTCRHEEVCECGACHRIVMPDGI